MKLVLITLLLLELVSISLQAQTMYVKEKNGTKTVYTLSNIKKLNFQPGKFTISKAGGNSEMFILNELRSVVFTDPVSNVPMVKTKDITVQLLENGTATIAEDAVNDGSTDNYGIQSYKTNITQFTCADVNHPVLVTLTITNINAKSNTKTAIVKVEDNIAPEVLTKPITVQLLSDGTATIT